METLQYNSKCGQYQIHGYLDNDNNIRYTLSIPDTIGSDKFISVRTSDVAYALNGQYTVLRYKNDVFLMEIIMGPFEGAYMLHVTECSVKN